MIFLIYFLFFKLTYTLKCRVMSMVSHVIVNALLIFYSQLLLVLVILLFSCPSFLEINNMLIYQNKWRVYTYFHIHRLQKFPSEPDTKLNILCSMTQQSKIFYLAKVYAFLIQEKVY